MPRGSNPSKVQQWAERRERFARSGQTVVRFCQAEGVPEAPFYQWKKKLAPQAGQRLPRRNLHRPCFRPWK